MAFSPGFRSWFALDNAAGTPTNLSSYMDSVDAPQSAASLEVSNFGTTAKAFIAGIQGGDKIAIKGPFDQTVQAHFGSCIAAQAAGTASFTAIFGPGGSVSGQAKISVETLIESYKPSTTAAGRVEWEASLQVTGALVNSVW